MAAEQQIVRVPPSPIGGLNVEPRDNEVWTRHGEEEILRRIGSTQWTFIGTCNKKNVIANAFWALELSSSNPPSGVTHLYSVTATDTVDLAHMSTGGVCSTHTPTVNELVLVGGGFTTEVYRVVAASGTSFELERPYEGETGNYSCRFVPQLARDSAGANASYYSASGGSFVVFEQLVTHTAGDMHGTSPAVVGGRRYLIITSVFGTPVAIDLGVVTSVKRNWFYRTGLAAGTETSVPSTNGYGYVAEVFAGRLFIGGAPDNNDRLNDRTIWYSKYGDFLQWHTGNKGLTASPNFVTFSGPNDDIAALRVLRGQLIVHRQLTQEIGSETGSAAQPITFRTNDQHLGLYEQYKPLCVHTRGAHFIWTLRGPAVFDGSVSLIAPEAYRTLNACFANEAPKNIGVVVHDEQRGRIYWVLGDANDDRPFRHQDATTPASEARYLSNISANGSYPAARTVFVHDYERNEFWFEDRTSIYGGGYIGEPTPTNDQGTYVSRYDGTIVKLRGYLSGIDPGISGSSEDHVVEAQADTPWIDLGAPTSKKLNKVEAVCRALHVSDDVDGVPDQISNVWSSPDDRLFLRLRVYGDYDEVTPIADVSDSFLVSKMLALGFTENRQLPQFRFEFTPDCSATVVKLRISNALTDAARAAGLKMAPFRLSEFIVHFGVKESDRARNAINA